MIRLIRKEEIPECIMFFNLHSIAFSDTYIKGYFCNGIQFKNYNMYQSMLSGNIIVYGEFDDNNELIDIVIFEYLNEASFTYILLDMFHDRNTEIIKAAIQMIFEQFHDIEKIKIELCTMSLSQEVIESLSTVGFTEELCIRKFNNKKHDIHIYAYFRR